jgi:hypothetical protein
MSLVSSRSLFIVMVGISVAGLNFSISSLFRLSLKNFVGVLGTSLTLAKEYTGSSGLDGFL